MKKWVITMVMIFSLGSIGFAQSNKRQGLKAKNYKLWKDDSEKSPVFYQVKSTENKTSLEVKNSTPGEKEEGATLEKVKLGNTKRSGLKGLKAKHFKP